jgi:hypothetical protein
MKGKKKGALPLSERRSLSANQRGRAATLLLVIATAVMQAAMPPHASLQVTIRDRFLPAGSEFSFSVQVHGLQEEAAPPRALLLRALTLKFPGFHQTSGPQVEPAGQVTFRGRINQPGVFPFEVSLQAAGQTYTARNYVVARESSEPGAFDHMGYYVFLGRGDYWDETHKLALSRLDDWEEVVDWMSVRRLDTLFCLLNGYTLAYPSEKYSSLIDKFSLNARYNFLGKLIDYAHQRNVKVYLTLTTDDHAASFGKLHPEALRLNRDGFKATDRALCLENQEVQRYITAMFEEALDLYPHADGVLIHPSEEDPDRYNDETKEAYYRSTGKELTHSTKEERYRWYNETYAQFAARLYSLVTAKQAVMDFIMFNCWWQDEYASVYKRLLPARVRICAWYYGWDDTKYQKWPLYTWVENFGPERILFMPTGPAFLYPADPWQQLERHIGTDRLASAVEALGVKSCIFFAGWDLGTENDRIRDLMLTKFPTTIWVKDGARKLSVTKALYENYWEARQDVLR